MSRLVYKKKHEEIILNTVEIITIMFAKMFFPTGYHHLFAIFQMTSVIPFLIIQTQMRILDKSKEEHVQLVRLQQLYVHI